MKRNQTRSKPEADQKQTRSKPEAEKEYIKCRSELGHLKQK